MLTVTEVALGYLSDALSQTKPPRSEDDCFRITVTDDRTFSIAVQAAESGDHTFDREGETVLAVPKELSSALSSKVLDLGDNGGLVMLPKPG